MNKTILFIGAVVMVVVILIAVWITATHSNTNTAYDGDDYVVASEDLLPVDLIDGTPSSDLTDAEIEGLLMMREEEKLARDVYLTLYDEWGVRIFSNIAESEQTHTDAVKNLLARYGLEDPVVDDTIGVFANPEFTALYNDLVEQGRESLVDGLIVGATIEDLDIVDLRKLSAETDNEDIQLVYANLERGSENHIRAFTRQIDSRGGSYSAQFLTEAELIEILK